MKTQDAIDLEIRAGWKLQSLKEYQLYKLLKDTLFKTMESTKSNTYERYDCVIPGGVIELKCRRAHYSTLRIEKSKYDSIINNEKAYYICSTPNGIYAFDLKKLQPIWIETLNPQTTDFNRHKMVLKETYDIPVNKYNDITSRIYKELIKTTELSKDNGTI